MDLIDHLLEHDRWATLSLLEASRNMSDARLDHEFDIGHRTLRNTYQHPIHNNAVWSGVVAGRLLSGNPSDSPPDNSIDALIAWFERTHAIFADLVKQLAEGHRLDYTFVDHFGERAAFGGAFLYIMCSTAPNTAPKRYISCSDLVY